MLMNNEDAAEKPASPASAHKNKITVRGLNFYYGENRALKDSHSAPLRGPGHRLHRPVRLRQVDASARAQPDVRPLSQASGPRAKSCSTARTSSIQRLDLNLLRSRVGMVFQKPTPFPMTIYDNIAFGIRLYEKLPKSEMDARVELALQAVGAVGRGQGQAERERPQSLGRTAAAALHRPHRGDQPGSDPVRRAGVGARSDLDRQDRRADRRAVRATTRSPSSPTTCSRPRASPHYTAFMYLGELVEFDETKQFFTSPRDKRTQDYVTGRFG